MIGISDASHCWKGLATKVPSASNHRVNGDDSSSVFSSLLEVSQRTVSLYTGVCLVTLDAIDSFHLINGGSLLIQC